MAKTSLIQRVYDEVPNLSTMYQARPDDPASVKAEARRFKAEEYLRDWMPPVVFRGINRLRRVPKKIVRLLQR